MRRRGRRMMLMSRRWRRVCWSNSPWSFFPFVSFTYSSCFKVLSSKKKLNNHIVEIDPTSWIIWWLPRHQITCHSPPCSVWQCHHCGKNFSRKSSLSKHMVHGDSNDIVVGANTQTFSSTGYSKELSLAHPTGSRHCWLPEMLYLVACHMHFE